MCTGVHQLPTLVYTSTPSVHSTVYTGVLVWCTPVCWCTPANVCLVFGLHETLYRVLSSYGSFFVPQFGNDLIVQFKSIFTVYRLTHPKVYYFLCTKQNSVAAVFRTDFLRTSPCKQYRRNTTKHGSARHHLCSAGHCSMNDGKLRKERNTSRG